MIVFSMDGFMRRMVIALSGAMFAVSPLAAAVVETLDFRAGERAMGDWRSAWVLESAAAGVDGAMRIESAPGNEDHALILDDVHDSRAAGGGDADGTPVISHAFTSLARGSLAFSAGTGGSQNQHASITVLSKGRELLLVKLVNNTSGLVVSATGEAAFSDDSWFNKVRDYEITWEPQPDGGRAVTVVFYPKDREPVVFGPLQFLAPGDPDQIRLQVGFGSAVGKSLRIGRITLSSYK
ncbi:MAG: hypothetical protein ABII82_06860 [Verrucomicrobiota bacterium]